MPAFFQQDKACPGDHLGNVGCAFQRDKVVIAMQDQGGNIQPFKIGKQIVSARQPRFVQEFALLFSGP